MSTVGNNTASDALHEPGETPATIDAFLRGVADEVALACAPDVLIDVNVPTWRSQLKGRDALRHILTKQEFLPEGTVVTWRSTTTADGHLLEVETHAPIEGKQRKWRQVVRLRGNSVRWLRRGLAGPDTWVGLAAGAWPGRIPDVLDPRRETGGAARDAGPGGVVGQGWPGSGGGPGVLAAGSRIAGYLLEEEIGAGGMAVVFRARDERLGRPVALKVLAPHLAADEGFGRRFLRESQAAAAVDDPHIIPVYEAGQAGGVLFIAMRYVSGRDVRGLVRRQGPLPPGRAAAIISPVAAALDAAHSVGLVHRDVKPGNMLIDAREGRPDHVYLSDFGIVKGAVSSVALTGTGFIGTAAYSAPEQIQGQVVDGRTDQYALACVTYELLTGTVPFERDQDVAMMLAHLSAPPPSLVAKRPDLPGAVDQVLATAMAKVPEERYESCGAFADALREALGLLAYDRDPASVPARAAVAARRAPGAPGAPDATVIGPPRTLRPAVLSVGAGSVAG